MRSGDTKPVNAAKVYLTKESFHKIVGSSTMSWMNGSQRTSSSTEAVWAGGMGEWSLTLAPSWASSVF